MLLTWWLRRTKQRIESARGRPAVRGPKYRSPAYRPTMELMEDRIVPASRLFAIPPGNQIHELNPTTGAILNTIPAPEPTTNGQNGLAFDGTRLFFINGDGSDRLYELNPNTGAVIDNDQITAGSGAYSGLAVVAGQVYIQDEVANQIFVFDPISDVITRTLNPGVDLIGSLAGASSPGALIGPINGGNLIAEIDPTTGAVTNTFQPGFPGLLGAAVVGNEIYLGSGGTGAIFRYTRAGTFLGQISTPFPMAALASDDTSNVPAPPGPGAQFVNGNFEAGNVSGWTVFNQQPPGAASPGFQAYTGPNPLGSQLPAPPQGNFAAFANHGNPGSYILYQDVTLPAGQFHTLSLQVYYNNLAGQFVTPNTLGPTVGAPNQQFRIDVISPTGDLLSTAPGVVLLNLFRTDVGEPNVLAPTTLSADLTPFAGQTVRLRIAVVDSLAPLFGAVDDVQLLSTGTAPTGTVAGVKFNDLDGDGTRDAGEAGLPGWTIYADLNNNRRFDANEPSTVTGADGTYTLTLSPGAYTFREVPQAGWVQTAPTFERLFTVRAGTAGGPQLISEVGATGALINTFNGPVAVPVLGPQGLATSGDSLFYINGAGPQNSAGPHTLFELDPATGAVLDSDVLPATAEINGLAYLGGLVYVQAHPTNQILVFDPATDTVVRTLTVGADLFGGLAGAPDLGLLFATVNPGQIVAINPQTGAIVRTLFPNLGFIGGGLAYYRGELLVSVGAPTATRINPQTGAVLGTINLSGPGGSVTGLGGDGRVGGGQRLTVATNQSVNLDFGNRRDEGVVTGVKFNDLDGDGTRDANELGLAGWTIYADLNNNRRFDTGEPSTVTGADGAYTLTVPSGFHSIREVVQSGWVQTSPLSYSLYATAVDGQLLTTINPATGMTTVVGPFGSPQTFSLAFSPTDGTLWAITNPFNSTLARLARVDPATGAATPVGGPLGISAPIRALEADAAGNLYAATSNGQFYSLNRTTGAATLIGPLGFPEVVDLAFDPAGGLWGVRGNQLFRIDPATGASAFVANIVGVSGIPLGLMIHPGTGTFYLTTSASILHTLNPVTGLATPVGPFTGGPPASFGGDFAVDNGHAVAVTPGASFVRRDFGNQRNEGVVSGVKYEDLDGDGTRDAGEPALSGWTVYADVNNNGRLDTGEPSAVTGADGSYQFTLASGSYAIREVPQAGWVQTGPTGDRLFALRSTGPQTLNVVELDPLGSPINTFPAPAPVASFGLQGLAVGRSSLFYIDGSSGTNGTRTLYELDPFTGAVLDADALPIPGAPVSGLGHLDGLVYVLNSATNQILVFNPVTDTVVRTLTPGLPLFGGLTGAADLGLLFATSSSQIVALNPLTGAVVRIIPVGAPASVGGLAYRAGELLGVTLSSGSSQILRIDPNTGFIRGALFPAGSNTTALGGDGPLPGAHRVTVTPGAVLANRDFGNVRLVPPVATDDAGTVSEDGVLVVPAPGVLGNDASVLGPKVVTAVNGTAAAVGQLITLPSGSRLRLNADGGYTYTPANSFNVLRAGQTATDSFTYTMTDGTLTAAAATVTVTVVGANDAPTALPDTFFTTEDAPITRNVVANDIDPDVGDTLTVIEVNGSAAAVGQTITLASGARLTLRADGTFDYDPSGAWDQLAAGQTSVDRFLYRIADGSGATSQTTATINLTGVNDAPIAVADAGETDEDTPLVVAAPAVLGNDTDVDTGDTRTVVAVNGSAAAVGQTVTLASGARITLRADGSYDYDPSGAFDFLRDGESATDAVEYTMADAAGATATAALTLTVRGLNDAPVAGDDVGSTDENTALNVGAPGLLGNDADPDRNTLTVVEVNAGGAIGQPITLSSGAIVTVLADGGYVYDPNGAFEALAPGETATDTFTYRVSDGTASDVATVTITINGVNDAPVANPDEYATDEDTELIVLASGVLLNDTDVDGGPLTAAVLGEPANGTVTVNPDGSFTYRPNANFNGTDTFTYTASDGRGGTATGTVTVTVQPVNDAPTLAGATFTVPENSPNGTVVGTVTGADVDGDTLTYRIVGGNTAGAFAIDPATGRITVANVAALDFETTPTFDLTVEVRDPAGLTATATVTVRLSNVIEVRIDIEPNDDRNRINHRSRGKVSVAILSSHEFNALSVNPFSLRFGRTGQEDSLSRIGGLIPRVRYTDVNQDGRLDMVVEFEIEETGFLPGDTKGILTGEFRNGTAFSAEDVVSVR